MASKFYAVRAGRKTGIFGTWDECKAQVTGFKGAQYKSFSTKEEAYEYIEVQKKPSNLEELPYAFVDGSYNIATKVYGYGGFLVFNGERHVVSGSGSDEEMASMRNVAGEVLGSTAAVKMAIELGIPELVVYYDYLGIQMWATGEWKRNKTGTIAYHDYIESVQDKIKIHFVKVAAHTGVAGNEEADTLAKKAVGIL